MMTFPCAMLITPMSAENGSIAVGKRADLVPWDPAFFGVKPEMVLIGGMIACAQMGDLNASIPTPRRPQTLAVTNTRKVGKRDLILNSDTPQIEVHPETYEVRANDELLPCAPADVLPMAQRYFLC